MPIIKDFSELKALVDAGHLGQRFITDHQVVWQVNSEQVSYSEGVNSTVHLAIPLLERLGFGEYIQRNSKDPGWDRGLDRPILRPISWDEKSQIAVFQLRADTKEEHSLRYVKQGQKKSLQLGIAAVAGSRDLSGRGFVTKFTLSNMRYFDCLFKSKPSPIMVPYYVIEKENLLVVDLSAFTIMKSKKPANGKPTNGKPKPAVVDPVQEAPQTLGQLVKAINQKLAEMNQGEAEVTVYKNGDGKPQIRIGVSMVFD